MAALHLWFDRRTAELSPCGSLLEFGCGRTFYLSRLLVGRFSERCATDIEEVRPSDVTAGVCFRRCTTTTIPFDSDQFDVVVIRSVIEHLDDPAETFRELARVTKPGGHLLMNLPNKWDYVSILARMAGRFKSPILKTVVRTGWDDFPVRYRCNTRAALNRVLRGTGWRVVQFRPLPSQPSYLSFFVPFYVLGAVYQFAISILALDLLQPSFVVMLTKSDMRE